jgi:two-component system response regulator AtoC
MAAALLEPSIRNRSKSSPHIVVLDSDPAILDYIRGILPDHYSVGLFTDPTAFIEFLKESPEPDLVLMEWLYFGGDSGDTPIKLLTKLLASKPALRVVMLSCSTDLKEVVHATRIGAIDILVKPFQKAEIDQLLQQHVTEVNCGQVCIKETPLDENTSFVRCSKRMREIESQCTLVARTDIPVLILGESGTGKEIAAKFIHKMSARSHRSFLKVNCAAMPLDLLESELFGYEQGAFTGAVKSKPGKFEICNNGTIFLDEIGEMPTTLQAKLLQVLQDGSFCRLGGRASVKVDVRVIAATNVNIKAAIAQKAFREDLYYRLNGFCMTVPPLRERRDEIPILAQYFMRRIASKYESDPLPFSPALMRALCSHAWPGNLRELENVIKRYIVLADEHAIIGELTPHLNMELPNTSLEDANVRCGLKRLVRGLKDDTEAVVIAQALEGTRWNRKAAAFELQISYKALLYKIKQYNLNQPRSA